MNCEEIQTRISEYFERSLDAISMKSIEVHLSSCSRCRADADSIADCIQEVARLPMVDPPLGFTQRVMAHAREIDGTPTVWERLFLPLRVKIPLQATAVVLIGALAVVLSQKEEQVKKLPSSEQAVPTSTLSAPSEQKFEQRKESTIVVERSVPDEKPAKSTVKPFADLAKQAPEQVQTNRAAAASAAIEQTQPAAPTTAKADGESRAEDKKEAPRRRPIPAQEVSTAGEAMRSRGDTLGFALGPGAGVMSQPSLSAGPLLERSLSPLSEPNADIEFVVRRRPQPREKDEASFAATGKTAESRRTNPPLAAPRTSSIREIRWFTVAADRFEQFKKALEAEAIIESERTPGVIESDLAQKIARELLIKVTISPSEQ